MKHHENRGESGAIVPGGYAVHEKLKAKRDPEHRHKAKKHHKVRKEQLGAPSKVLCVFSFHKVKEEKHHHGHHGHHEHGGHHHGHEHGGHHHGHEHGGHHH